MKMMRLTAEQSTFHTVTDSAYSQPAYSIYAFSGRIYPQTTGNRPIDPRTKAECYTKFANAVFYCGRATKGKGKGSVQCEKAAIDFFGSCGKLAEEIRKKEDN